MFRDTETIAMSAARPARPYAMAQAIGSGFMPVIFHPERTVYRFECKRRKIKATPEAAIQYAERVLWWRQLRDNAKRRRREATADPWWRNAVHKLEAAE